MRSTSRLPRVVGARLARGVGRVVAALAVGASVVAAGALPAGAHAAFESPSVPTDSDQTLTLSVPEEREETMHNVGIDVTLPFGWTVLGCEATASWTCDIGLAASGTVVHYAKLGTSPSADDETFRFSVHTPTNVGMWWFPTTQIYSDGMTIPWAEEGGPYPAPPIETVATNTTTPTDPPTIPTSDPAPHPAPTTGPSSTGPAPTTQTAGGAPLPEAPSVPDGDASPTPTDRSTPTRRTSPSTRRPTTTAAMPTTTVAGVATEPPGDDGVPDSRRASRPRGTPSGTAVDEAITATGDGAEGSPSRRIRYDDEGSALPVLVSGAVVLGLLALGGGLAAQHRSMIIAEGPAESDPTRLDTDQPDGPDQPDDPDEGPDP